MAICHRERERNAVGRTTTPVKVCRRCTGAAVRLRRGAFRRELRGVGHPRAGTEDPRVGGSIPPPGTRSSELEHLGPPDKPWRALWSSAVAGAGASTPGPNFSERATLRPARTVHLDQWTPGPGGPGADPAGHDTRPARSTRRHRTDRPTGGSAAVPRQVLQAAPAGAAAGSASRRSPSRAPGTASA